MVNHTPLLSFFYPQSILSILIINIMPKWSKDSDWLPLDNAKAQVKFWEQDLVYAKKYLAFIQKVKPKLPSKFYIKVLAIAEKDVRDSLKYLEQAKAKVEESEDLE